MRTVTKEYSNGEVTIVWKNSLCAHSGICVRGLPAVFNIRASPWIDAQGAPSEELVRQVKECPSGALSYYRNADHTEKKEI